MQLTSQTPNGRRHLCSHNYDYQGGHSPPNERNYRNRQRQPLHGAPKAELLSGPCPREPGVLADEVQEAEHPLRRCAAHPGPGAQAREPAASVIDLTLAQPHLISPGVGFHSHATAHTQHPSVLAANAVSEKSTPEQYAVSLVQ